MRGALLVSLLAELLVASAARSAPYDRKVRIDWVPIEGAGKYEVQWLKAGADGVCAPEAMDADSAAAIDAVDSTFWQKSLPGGGYCMRVRGIGVGDRPGQWTDPQRLEVRPKPPGGLQWEDAGRLSWEKVPYAGKYEIEVRDSAGRTAARAEIEGTEYQIPTEVFRREKLGESFSVRVSSMVDGTAKSAATVRGFTADEVFGLGRAEGAPGVPKPRERRLPPQPSATALSPEEVEERFTLIGEVPLPPSDDDWARARSPAQVANLRTRTIASARLELNGELDRAREPDLRLKAGVFYGGFFMSSRGISGDVQALLENHSSGARYELEAELGHDRPWGAEFSFRTTPADFDIGREMDLSTASAMIVRNLGLDPYWQSVLSFRFGGLLYAVPHVEDQRDGGSAIPVVVEGFAVSGGLGYRQTIGDEWSVSARVDGQAGPGQGTFEAVEPANLVGYGGELAAGYRASRELELEAGIAASRVELTAERVNGAGKGGTTWASAGAFVRGIFRTPSGERRGPASRASLEGVSRVLEARLTMPVALLSQAIITEAGPGTTAKGTEAGAALRVTVRMGGGSRWVARLDAETISGSSAHGAFRLGYETPLMGRDDTRATLLLGPGVRRDRDAGDPTAGDISARILAFEPGLRLSRTLSASLSGETEFSVGLPLSVRSGSGAGSAGTSRYWSFELALGHRLGGDLTLWTGYAHRNAQYSTVRPSDTDPVGPMNLTRNEDQVRLGISIAF